MKSVSNTCFVRVKDGKPFNKYEVRQTTTNRFTCTANVEFWYFDKEEDAELYRRFLLERIGETEIHRLAGSSTVTSFDRKAYREFIDNTDFHQYDVSGLNFLYESRSVKWEPKSKNQQEKQSQDF